MVDRCCNTDEAALSELNKVNCLAIKFALAEKGEGCPGADAFSFPKFEACNPVTLNTAITGQAQMIAAAKAKEFMMSGDSQQVAMGKAGQIAAQYGAACQASMVPPFPEDKVCECARGISEEMIRRVGFCMMGSPPTLLYDIRTRCKIREPGFKMTKLTVRSEYGAWGACSSTCGDGQQKRERTCEGLGCGGATETDFKACNLMPCDDCIGRVKKLCKGKCKYNKKQNLCFTKGLADKSLSNEDKDKLCGTQKAKAKKCVNKAKKKFGITCEIRENKCRAATQG